MATPVRRKRNFKALQLQSPPTSPATTNPNPIPLVVDLPKATRTAPVPMAAPPPVSATTPASGRRRPPPMTIKAPKIPISQVTATVEQDAELLVPAAGTPGPTSASASVRRNTYHAKLSSTLANLDMNTEIKFDLRNEDLKDLQELGQGNGGSVKKVEHVPTKTIMAKKVCQALSLNSVVY